MQLFKWYLHRLILSLESNLRDEKGVCPGGLWFLGLTLL